MKPVESAEHELPIELAPGEAECFDWSPKEMVELVFVGFEAETARRVMVRAFQVGINVVASYCQGALFVFVGGEQIEARSLRRVIRPNERVRLEVVNVSLEPVHVIPVYFTRKLDDVDG